MSKFNAVRLINLNYNDNTIKISDETFQLNGESTLLSLRNGGGKSVLVQMMIAPFVHKRYRDAKERPFESYFTTNKPSFILVEWALDRGAGYVMTGMMVRRRQEISSEAVDELEMIQFICEYEHPCPQDIHHLPVVEKKKKEMVLKNFSTCKQLFESYKKDRNVAFYSYDMNNSAQSRQYYNKLMEYQIHYKEWENIMKKINLKESGLSDLFADCKDEKGLVEKWLLDSVANKLNKENDRMKEFREIVQKYVSQYKDNQSKIKRRDIIRQFEEEAAGILETAQSYAAVQGELVMHRQRIGIFLWQLGAARDAANAKWKQLDEGKEQITRQIAHLKYQQISKTVYEAMETERYHRANREMIQLERTACEQEYENTKHQICLLDMARQQNELAQQQAECAGYAQQLAVLGKKEQDFAKERTYLGYALRLYYEAAAQNNQAQAEQESSNLENTQVKIAAEEEKETAYRAQILEHSTTIGSLEAKLQEYDAKEEAYNRHYAAGLVRNILGEYEPAELEIREQEYGKELDGLKKTYRSLQKEAEEGSWQQKKKERDLEDSKHKKLQKEMELSSVAAICEQYRKELEKRRTLLRYFELDESSLYDMDKIIHTAEKKLAEIEIAKRKLEKEEDQLQKEYQRLTQGKVLELPEEFSMMLEEIGISPVYGMDWLKKNQYTEEENRTFVRNYPFLPYALLLSSRDLKKLQEQKQTPYTSVPIPLMVREQLERGGQAAGQPEAVVNLADVNFYVLFNEHLLNESLLQQMIAQKEQQIAKKKAQIQTRREEYESYFEKKEQLRAQKVTKDRQEQEEQRQEQLKAEINQLSAAIVTQKEEVGKLIEHLHRLARQMQENGKSQAIQERRLEDLRELRKAYAAYQQQKQQLEKWTAERLRAKEKEQLAHSVAQKLCEQAKILEIELERLKHKEEEIMQKLSRYEQYQKEPDDSWEQSTQDVQEMENRYQAITSQLSLRQQEIERLLQAAQEKLRRMERELARRQKKYQLQDGEWKQTVYDPKAEEYQEQLLRKKEQQYELKKAQWNEADKNAALASQRLEQQRRLLAEKCQKSEPLPQEEIQPVDFESEIEQREYRCQQLTDEQKIQQKRTGWYEENLTALAEFAEYAPQNEAELWDMLGEDLESKDVQSQQAQDAAALSERLSDLSMQAKALEIIHSLQTEMEKLSGEQLRKEKGLLVRDYNRCQEHRQQEKDRLNGKLNQMVRKEIFAEDFYRKPIEAMLSLTDDAAQVIRQLQTTIQSYNNLMEKIQVDISVIEKEKERIVELLGAYLYEVHQDLGRIDRNSTITVRAKPIRMLKINLPVWEENERLYQMRIEDFMDETTKKGIALLQQNENAQEYFGVRMTTKNLYDAVVGIANVQIRMYKIEEQREVPITWSQVAKNSGGEGFLSAFIILTSLLCYMRHDDTDLFAQRNEGKVLVMDNPFAQTNAVHLLKPLTDMAKKTNTQLICLSGLGGESIYNQFDNIYVLNLIAASMRSGTQYLKAEQMRGAQPDTMVLSQIEVLEQQELVF